MKKTMLFLSIAALFSAGSAVAAQADQQQTAPSYHQINELLLGNSGVRMLPRHHLQMNHHVWLAGFAQASLAYNSNYLLMPNSTLMYPLAELEMPASSVSLSFNQIDTYVGFSTKRANFIAGMQYQAVPSYDGLFSSTISMDQQFGLTEAYFTYAVNPNIGVKIGQFNPDFGQYNTLSPMLSAVGLLNSSIIPGADYSATPGAEVALREGRFYGTLSLLNQQTAGVGPLPPGNHAKLNAVLFDGGYDVDLKGGNIGIEGSYISKGTQLTPLDPASEWKPVWTVNAHYRIHRFKSSAGVYHEQLGNGNPSPYVMSAQGDFKVMRRIGLGVYGDYMTKTSDPSMLEIFEPVHWLAGVHAELIMNHQVTLDGYVQHMKMFGDGAIPNNTSVIGTVSFKF